MFFGLAMSSFPENDASRCFFEMLIAEESDIGTALWDWLVKRQFCPIAVRP
jgi:hypothetical protein